MGELLRVEDLKTHFFTSEGVGKAVDGVSFQIHSGETLGLVGESGCGKTVTALSILRLVPDPPGKIVGGAIHFDGEDLVQLDSDRLRKIRGNRISMIFQEPMTSLNPVFTIGNQISEAIRLHQGLGPREALDRSIEMLRMVGIPSPERRVHDYPHQLSGGMCQRAMIAMALSCNPELLIADEPTTALDVTIQAQILDLLIKLKEETGAAILLITHDLGVIAEMADRVAVMYAGNIVEEADVKTLFTSPLHPYTQGLLGSIPGLGSPGNGGRRKKRLREIPGIVPSLFAMPSGCKFNPRCPKVMDVCTQRDPEEKRASDRHRAKCFLVT
jgi:oligopeptide/dipeptide ABC transporter ATP-binding protein